MMAYVNSLLALRVITIVLLILLLGDYDVFIELLRLSAITFSEPTTRRNWSEIDIFSPPPLNDRRLEASRFIELIARTQYKCKETHMIADTFSICADDLENNSNQISVQTALFISGSRNQHTSFVKSLNATHWTFFVPDGFQPIEALGDVDVEMHYIFELGDSGSWPIEEMQSEIKNRQFDSALIDIYGPSIFTGSKRGYQSIDAPKLIENLLKVLSAKYFQLVIRFEADDKSEVLFAWYQLLYDIFFRYNFALIEAQKSAMCDLKMGRCLYRLSMARFVTYAEVELPVFGLGSPMEERKRLIHYLSDVNKTVDDCVPQLYNDDDIPNFCQIDENSKCIVIYVRYRRLSEAESLISFDSCNLIFFYPEETDLRIKHKSLQLYKYGISPNVLANSTVPAYDDDVMWQLITFNDLMSSANGEVVQKLVLDLNGGEWDVFSAILESKIFAKTVMEVIIRLRLWIGEEHENYRRFLNYFLQLEKLGFQKRAFEALNMTTFVIAFKNTLG